jgi:hypothetical protein
MTDDVEEEDDEDTPFKRDREKDEEIAYLIGPRKDGLILNKDGTILDVNENPSRKRKAVNKSTRNKDKNSNDLPHIDHIPLRPHWTEQLIVFQLGQLKKGHKMRRQKIAIKLMRQIRTTVPRIKGQDANRGVKKEPSQSRGSNTQLALPAFDAKRGFLNLPNSPLLIHQCMNALTPPKSNKH